MLGNTANAAMSAGSNSRGQPFRRSEDSRFTGSQVAETMRALSFSINFSRTEHDAIFTEQAKNTGPRQLEPASSHGGTSGSRRLVFVALCSRRGHRGRQPRSTPRRWTRRFDAYTRQITKMENRTPREKLRAQAYRNICFCHCLHS